MLVNVYLYKEYMKKINVAKFKDMLLSGSTYQEIAVEFNTSRQNVYLWRKHWFPDTPKHQIGAGLRATNRRQTIPSGYTLYGDDALSRAKAAYFTRKKQNSKQKKWEFSITFKEVIWNDICPVLGIPINWFNETRGEDSPSMDRTDPTKGYVPGNVQIISWRANRIKNDGSAEEHQRIADYLAALKYIL